MKVANIKEHLRTLRDLTRTRVSLREIMQRLNAQNSAQRELYEKLDALKGSVDRLTDENQNLRQMLSEQASRYHNMLAEAVSPIQDDISRLTDRSGELEHALDGHLGRMARELARLNGISDAQRRSYADITRRLTETPAAADKQVFALADDPFLNIFYREFEDRYRGSREEIVLRLRAYLGHLNFLADRPADDVKIVDLGCGRGEWLQVLQEAGYTPLGIDNNEAQAEAAQELGLSVEIDEALSWLARQKDHSVDFISAFHLIEHLEFPVLVRLFKETMRILKPGGGFLVETPNPESLIVGAYKFWFDPTHIRPYPPELVTQLLETLTFRDIQVLRLHPDGRNQEYKLRGLPEPVADLMVGPLDYGVLCRRP